MTLTEMNEDIKQMERNHVQNLMKSQEPFIHGGTFHFGRWREWHLAQSPEEADRLLQDFRHSLADAKAPE